MIKKTNILWTMTTAVLTLFSACTSDDGVLQEGERVPIMISTAISPTRSTTTQDTQIAEDQLVYLWGFKQSGSGAAEFSNSYFTDVTDYWLTKVKSDGSLIGNSFTEKYYYPSEALTMVGIHGNFTAVDGSVGNADTHNVFADQSTLSNYAQSDLLHWSAYDLSSSSTAISAQFSHKLCKIVVVLQSNIYSDADLNKALVTLNGVQPTISITPQTGALSSLDGTATTIKPYKSDDIHREAIIPPQAKPNEFITITMNGYTTTATPDEPTGGYFVANTKYIYTITVNKTGISISTAITPWGTDNAAINVSPGVSSRNVKMNPLWYMAKSNLNQDLKSFSIEKSVKQGYMWLWANAMNKGFTASTNSYDGYATPATPKTVYGDGNEEGVSWHMPTKMEWQSIVPFNVNIFSDSPAGANLVSEQPSTFGFNNSTKYSNGKDNTSNVGIAYQSYWSTYVANSNVRYAIRFLGTDYCSVWRYQIMNMGSGNTSARLVISSRLIDPIAETNTSAMEAMMATITDSGYDWSEDESIGAVQRTLYACGANSGADAAPTGSNYDSGGHGYYWCSTDVDATYVWNVLFGDNTLSTMSASQYKSYARPIRLFRDNPEQDVWKNPLWYVAEYNVKYTPTSGTAWDGGGGTFGFETTPRAGYLFLWSSALKYFTTASNYSAATPSAFNGYKKGTGSKLSGWHLPTASEMGSIFPGNLFYFNNGAFFDNKEYAYKGGLQTVNFGCNYETKTVGVVDNSYWHRVSNIELHAIRFLGTPYCSAWKYQWAFTSSPLKTTTLTVSATLIDPVANDATGLAAEIWYNTYWPQVFFGNDSSRGAVQRVFTGYGSYSPPDGNSPSNQPTPNSGNAIVYYWTSSTDESGNIGGFYSIADIDPSYIGRGGWGMYYYPSNRSSFPLRLFRDN